MTAASNIGINVSDLSDSGYAGLLDIAIPAAVDAGQLAMSYFGKKENKVRLKWDLSPVSDADKAVGKSISERLVQTGVNIVSEEEKVPSYNIRKDWGKIWIIDPIDGTRDFISGGSEFSVNIGLVVNGEAKMGVIYIPATKELYYGLSGVGAFKQNLANHELNLEYFSSGFKIVAEKNPVAVKVITTRSNYDVRVKKYIEKLRLVFPNLELLRCGSSIKYCRMAEGNANLFPRLNTIKEWDTAAGQAIAEASGCKVVGIDGKSQVLYNKKKMATLPNLVASDESLIKKLYYI